MRRSIAVVAALVLAALGALAVFWYTSAADARAMAGQQASTVYTTTRTVPAGTTLGDAVSEQMLEKTVLPSRSVPAGALLRVDRDMEDLVAVSEIAPGEVVLERRFGTQQVGSSALVVPEGQMAVTIELTDPGRVGAFLRPGSTIAVYNTFKVRDAEAGDLSPDGTSLGDAGEVNATRVLLASTTVIAVGDVTVEGRAPAAGADDVNRAVAVPTALVTVSVAPGDAARVVHAAQTGLLYAALVGTGADAGSPVVDDRDLFGGTP